MSTTPSRNIFSNLPPPAECLALLIGTAEVTIFGLTGLTNPAQWAINFGLPLPSMQNHPGAIEPEENEQTSKVRRTQKALVTAIAARNIQNGLLMLTFGFWVKDRRALGVAALLGCLTTATDYVVVRRYGVAETATGHLVGIFNCICVGGSLLFWGRNDPWW